MRAVAPPNLAGAGVGTVVGAGVTERGAGAASGAGAAAITGVALAGLVLARAGLAAGATAAAAVAFADGAAARVGTTVGVAARVFAALGATAAEAVGAGVVFCSGFGLEAAGAGVAGDLVVAADFAAGWAATVSFGGALLAAESGAAALVAGAVAITFAATGAGPGAAAEGLLIWFGFRVFLFDFILCMALNSNGSS